MAARGAIAVVTKRQSRVRFNCIDILPVLPVKTALSVRQPEPSVQPNEADDNQMMN